MIDVNESGAVTFKGRTLGYVTRQGSEYLARFAGGAAVCASRSEAIRVVASKMPIIL